jgi:hypothetical protein
LTLRGSQRAKFIAILAETSYFIVRAVDGDHIVQVNTSSRHSILNGGCESVDDYLTYTQVGDEDWGMIETVAFSGNDFAALGDGISCFLLLDIAGVTLVFSMLLLSVIPLKTTWKEASRAIFGLIWPELHVKK